MVDGNRPSILPQGVSLVGGEADIIADFAAQRVTRREDCGLFK